MEENVGIIGGVSLAGARLYWELVSAINWRTESHCAVALPVSLCLSPMMG